MVNYIVCVLKSGGDFLPIHVEALRRNLDKCLTVPYEFILFTNWYVDTKVQLGMVVMPLKYLWPGWWSKIEIFNPNIKWASDARVVYMDLDTVLIGNVDWLFDVDFSKADFVALGGFVYNRFASGLMGWQGAPPKQPFNRFIEKPEEHMRKFSKGGDQKFVYRALSNSGTRIAYWQELFPDKICSYKNHVVKEWGGALLDEASLVCFHGQPRPWDVGETWVKEARA